MAWELRAPCRALATTETRAYLHSLGNGGRGGRLLGIGVQYAEHRGVAGAMRVCGESEEAPRAMTGRGILCCVCVRARGRAALDPRSAICACACWLSCVCSLCSSVRAATGARVRIAAFVRI